MGKGKRLREKRKSGDFYGHAEDVLTRNFQKEIRNSEMWPQMVAEFGEQKALEVLRECKGELRPVGGQDVSGDCSTDI
jgi:hypothetical protein